MKGASIDANASPPQTLNREYQNMGSGNSTDKVQKRELYQNILRWKLLSAFGIRGKILLIFRSRW